MSWHIFRKDIRLLWPYALILALVYAARAWVFVRLGQFNEPDSLQVFADALPILVIAGMVALIAAVFYQDGLFSSTQDWRIRPLRRRDLLLAKLLFVVLAVHGPVFIIDVAEGMADGLPFTGTFINALVDGFFKFCLLSLPVAMLASMTDRPLSLLGAAIAVAIGGLLVAIFFVRYFGNGDAPLLASGVAWLTFLLCALTGIVTACIILPLQYFKRATPAAYLVFLVAVAVVGTTAFLPWEAAFSIQRLFAAQPGLATPIAVEFAPEKKPRARFRPPYPLPRISESDTGSVYMELPLSVTGLPADTTIFTDRAPVRLINSNGQVIASSAPKDASDTRLSAFINEIAPPSVPLVDSNGQVFASPNDPVLYVALLAIPPKLYLAYKQQALRLEIDLSLTLLQKSNTVTMPVLEKGIHSEQGFACGARVTEATGTVALSCLTASKVPSCSFTTLSHPSSGRIGLSLPVLPRCTPNYAPLGFTLNRLLIGHVNKSALFSNNGNGFQIEKAMLPDANIVLQNYEAQDHFTRQLVLPELRLGDWGPDR